MKNQFISIIIFLLLSKVSYSQATYKSLASEYFYQNLSSSAEWLERDIIISEKTIVIKSYGKNAKDIQTWRIQSREENKDTESANTVFYAELASGEKYEYPAIFLFTV